MQVLTWPVWYSVTVSVSLSLSGRGTTTNIAHLEVANIYAFNCDKMERHYAVLMPQSYVNHHDPAGFLIRRIPGQATAKYVQVYASTTGNSTSIRNSRAQRDFTWLLLLFLPPSLPIHGSNMTFRMAVRHKNRTRGDAVNHYAMFLFCHIIQERRSDAIHRSTTTTTTLLA